MIRVAVISQLPPPIHGSTIMTRAFLNTLHNLEHEFVLVDRRFSNSVSEVGKFSSRKLASGIWMPGRLLKAMLQFQPHVVVFFATNRTFSFVVDWALSEVLRWFRVGRINYLHTVGFETLASRSRVFNWMVGRLLGSAHTTVCLGPTLAQDVTPWVNPSRITFIPNTVMDRPDDLGERRQDVPPIVLYLSNLIPEKGAGAFIDLAIELAPEMPDATFIVAGATADEVFTDSLIERVHASGLDHRVRFVGAITDHQEKWRLLSDASVLVFPSTYPFEAQPLTILEALSVGTPVVAYDVGGIKDVVREGVDGETVPAGSVSEMARSVRRYCGPDSTGRTQKQRVSSTSSERVSVRAYRDGWKLVLARVADHQSGPPKERRDS